MANWTGVWRSDREEADGYFHVQKLYALLILLLSFFVLNFNFFYLDIIECCSRDFYILNIFCYPTFNEAT